MSVTTAQVTTLLENVLFESATLAGQNAASWTAIANLNASTSTVAGLSAYLATQPEAQIAARVVEYYQGALARVPSAFEISYYVAQAEQGLNATQISQGASGVPLATWVLISNEFAASPEFKADFGLSGGITASNAGLVVTGFYTNILGRAPTSVEIQYYANELTAGVPASALLQQFTESPEYQAKAVGTIQTNLAANGVSAVATVAAGGDPLAQGGSPIGGLPAPSNSSFVLTTGVDTLTGGSGNNVFVGQLDNNAGAALATPTATLGGADTITGAGVSNTLALTDSSTTGYDTLPVGATITNIQAITLKTAGNAGNFGTAALDTTGLSGLNSVAVTSSGTHGDAITSATTTDISLTTAGTGASKQTILGGHNVTVNVNGGSTGNTIVGDGTTDASGAISVTSNGTGSISIDGGSSATVVATKNDVGNIAVGTNDATTGAVTVTTSVLSSGSIQVGAAGKSVGGAVTINAGLGLSTGTATGNTIKVYGGTTDTVNVTIAPSKAAAAAQATNTNPLGTLTGGAITITGGAKTTAVTVTQTAAAAQATGTSAQAATSGTAAVAGAPGKEGTPATAGTASTPLVPGSYGIADGNVTIVDSKNTITTATVTNFGALTYTGNALTTLNLAGTANGAVTINDSATAGGTLTLNLNGVTAVTGATTGVTGILDKNSTFKEIDVVTTGKSTIGGIFGTNNTSADATLTTLKVNGTGSFKDSSFQYTTGLATVTVADSASFADSGKFATGLAVLGSTLTSFTTTSSGTISAALDSTKQTFVGGSGTDNITISATANATKTITAGSAANNELILGDGSADVTYALTSATAGKVTGFQILGVDKVDGTIDASVIQSTATKLDVIAGSGTAALTVNNLATNSAIAIDATLTKALTVGFVDASGVSDSTAVTLAKNITVAKLVLQDANSVGIGTVNIATGTSTTAVDTISTLVDTNVQHLGVTGSGLAITKLTEQANATAITIDNNGAGISGVTTQGLNIGTLTATNLGSFTFTGTGKTTIGAFAPGNTVTTLSINDNGGTATFTTLTDNSLTSINFNGTGAVKIGTLADTGTTLKLTNSGSATDTITTFTDANLTSLTVKGNIVLGASTTTTGGVKFAATTGITVSAQTDNAHVNLNLSAGAALGATDTITLGNANNHIIDASTKGTVNITVGTGSNLIALTGGGDVAYSASITLGAHTAPDVIDLATSKAATTLITNTITGASAGDQLVIADANPLVAVTLSSAQLTALAGQTSVANAINYVDSLLTAAHDYAVFTYGGNTYVLETAAAGAGAIATGDTLVELVGVHTVTATAAQLTAHTLVVGS